MKNKQKHFGLSDYVAFAIALVGAVLLWIYAIGFDSTVFTRTIGNVSVTVVGAEELAASNGFSLKEEVSFSITVDISGRRTDISGVKSSDLTAVVDISGVREAGYNTLPINVIAPNGITVSSQSETDAVLFLDRFISKSFAVKPEHTVSSFAANVRIKGETCNPSVVMVSGPQSVLETIDYVAARYSVGELSDNVTAYCSPEIVDHDGKAINNPYVSIVDLNEILVELSVYKEKTVPVEVVFIGGRYSTSVATIEMSASSLKIKGGVSAVDALGKLTVPIDETQFGDGVISTSVSVASILPDGFELCDGEPSTIDLNITVPAISERTLTVDAENIVFTAGGSQYVASSNVKLRIMGFTDEIQALEVGDLTVYVDASEPQYADNGRMFASCEVKIDGVTFFVVVSGDIVYLDYRPVVG